MQRFIIVLYTFLCGATLLHGQGRWSWQNPQPQGNSLNNIHVFSDGEILAAGTNSTLMRSSDDGVNWDIRYNVLGPEYYDFSEMQFVDNHIGWAMEASYSDIYYSTDRGATWETRTAAPFGFSELFAMDSLLAWGAGVAFATARTTDGGWTWTSHDVDSTHDFKGGGIFFLNQNQGWVVGSFFLQNYGRIFKTIDGGVTWTEQFTNSQNHTRLLEVFFLDGNTGWAGGEDALIMGTTDGGQTWTTQYQRPSTNFSILDMFFYDANNGIAVGTDGLIVTTADGGQTWEERASGTERWINDIYPGNDSTIWACGGNGVVLTSNDRGQTWSQISRTVTDDIIYRITFSDEMTGWAGGVGGLLLKTEDGGQNWFVADSGEQPIQVLQFLDSNNGYRIEWYGQTYRTRDGGDTWDLTEPFPHDGLYQNGFFADTSTGWLIWNYLGDGYIKKTGDGGQSWQIVLSTPGIWLSGIDFANGSTGWVCGRDNITIPDREGYIFKTTDGGSSWIEQTSVSEPLTEIDFIDENTGWCVGANGMMLATSDGGATWNPLTIPLTETLADVVMLDANSGWIFGNDGVARTLDGGQTWETFEMPGGPTRLYTQAYFRDADNGWLLEYPGKILKFDGNATGIDDGETPAGVPAAAELSQNYPNPFNPGTTISFTLPHASRITLRVFDLLGRRVRTLVEKQTPAGTHQVVWDGRNDAGQTVSSGVYLYRLTTNIGIAQTRRMLLVR